MIPSEEAAPAVTNATVLPLYFLSGVFIPALRTENRMVLTAARPDRTSFGCGEANTYTFFDQCFLESIPQSRDFPMLATKVQNCVAQREVAEGAMPPSEPQVSIGFNISQSLSAYSFAGN